jgi:hypothetical protein
MLSCMARSSGLITVANYCNIENTSTPNPDRPDGDNQFYNILNQMIMQMTGKFVWNSNLVFDSHGALVWTLGDTFL